MLTITNEGRCALVERCIDADVTLVVRDGIRRQRGVVVAERIAGNIRRGKGTEDTFGNQINYTVNAYTPGGQKLGAYTLTPLYNQQLSEMVMQVTATSNDTYFGSRRLAVMDQLGSVVKATSPVVSYFPWGETKGASNPQDTWNFATYWQDSTTALDYANNRYYSNIGGRVMTPDPSASSEDPRSPQSWNRFPYVQGDPVNRNDPSGLVSICPGGVDVVAQGAPAHALYGIVDGTVVVRRNGEPFAFGVDRMMGQQEIVVRPLEDPLVRVVGVSGVTDLGDGSPTLVLDLYALSGALGARRAAVAS